MLTTGKNLPPETHVLTVTLPMQEYHLLDLEEQIPEDLVLSSWAQLFTMVWAEDNPPGLTAHVFPVSVELVEHAKLVNMKQ